MGPQSFTHGSPRRTSRRRHGANAVPRIAHASSMLVHSDTGRVDFWQDQPTNSEMLICSSEPLRLEGQIPTVPINSYKYLRTRSSGSSNVPQSPLPHAASRPSSGSPVRGHHTLQHGSPATNKANSARGPAADQRRKHEASSRLSSQGDEWQTQFFRTKLCPYHLEGRCINGESCRFAHSPVEVRPLPDLQRTKLCESYVRQEGCTDPACPFAHDPSELRTSSHSFYKVTLCNFYKKGRCWNGAHCRFAHGVTELQTAAPSDSINSPQGHRRCVKSSHSAELSHSRTEDVVDSSSVDGDTSIKTKSDKTISDAYMETSAGQGRLDTYDAFLNPSTVRPSIVESGHSLSGNTFSNDSTNRRPDQTDGAPRGACLATECSPQQLHPVGGHSRQHGRLPPAYYASRVEKSNSGSHTSSSDTADVTCGSRPTDCIRQPAYHGLLNLAQVRLEHDGTPPSALTERIQRLPVSTPSRRNSFDGAQITQPTSMRFYDSAAGYFTHRDHPLLEVSPIFPHPCNESSLHEADRLATSCSPAESEGSVTMKVPMTREDQSRSKFHETIQSDPLIEGLNGSNLGAADGQVTAEELRTLTAALVSCLQDPSVMRPMTGVQEDHECDVDSHREIGREPVKSDTDTLTVEFLRSLLSLAGGHPALQPNLQQQPEIAQASMHDESSDTYPVSTLAKDKTFQFPAPASDWKTDVKVLEVGNPTYQQFLALAAAAASGGAVDENAPFSNVSNVLDISSLQTTGPTAQSLAPWRASLEALHGKGSSLTLPSLSSLVLGNILTRQGPTPSTVSGGAGDLCHDGQAALNGALDTSPRVFTQSLDNLVNFVDIPDDGAECEIEGSPENVSPVSGAAELRMAHLQTGVLNSTSGFGLVSQAPIAPDETACFPEDNAVCPQAPRKQSHEPGYLSSTVSPPMQPDFSRNNVISAGNDPFVSYGVRLPMQSACFQASVDEKESRSICAEEWTPAALRVNARRRTRPTDTVEGKRSCLPHSLQTAIQSSS